MTIPWFLLGSVLVAGGGGGLGIGLIADGGFKRGYTETLKGGRF